MPRPEVSLIVVTYQMPEHLERVLTSIARQTVLNQLEIIVSDDGSCDATPEVVRDFARLLDRPIRFLTHLHNGFHLTRCRNAGARVATAPYLLFLDGDCILPPDHVEQYLAVRRQGYVHFGYCYRLSREVSERVTKPAIVSGDFVRWGSCGERWKLTKLHAKSLFYEWIGHPTKPALKGGNIGIWRSDFERVNGFDENYRAWGCEDDDLSVRLRAAGLRVASILGRTRTYHLWHPPAASRPTTWSAGDNVAYFKRRGRLTRCVHGLVPRALADLKARLLGEQIPSHVRWIEDMFGRPAVDDPAPELEVRFAGDATLFSRRAQCRVLVSDAAPTDDSADLVLPSDAFAARRLLSEQLRLPIENEAGVVRAA
jgi:GT2 family glycosyltransferase